MTESAVDALAVARLVHLLQQDEVWPVREARDWYLERTGTSRWSMLAECPSCLSVWVAAAVGVARAAVPRPWSWIACALAASYVTAKLENM